MADMLAEPEDLASLLKRDLDLATATLDLEAATAAVQTVAGQRIVQVLDDEVTLDLDHDDRSLYLYLPEGPVTAVASASVGGVAVMDFRPQLSRGRVWRSLGWRSATLPQWDAPSDVTVVYSHGYAPGHQKLQYPRGIALSLAAALYENPTGASSERIDDYAVAYERAVALLEASKTTAQLLRTRYGRRGRSVKLVTAGGA